MVGETISASGPALFMRCSDCRKLTTVNSLITHADFAGDRIGVAVPKSITCLPCVKRNGAVNKRIGKDRL